MAEQKKVPASDNEGGDLTNLHSGPPLTVRMAHEIPKPKDWQALQRGCVVLFQAELKDPHAQEYGRNGQKQRGIDVLGRRNGDPNHFVGVQCRDVATPLKKATILTDCREALTIRAGLKEIIFATTAPSDTRATDAAIEVERELRAEGHDITVVVYAWPDLELRIALHETAYNVFFPGAVASSASFTKEQVDPLSVSIADVVATRLQQSNQSAVPAENRCFPGPVPVEESVLGCQGGPFCFAIKRRP
jgi:hypothetical protein